MATTSFLGLQRRVLALLLVIGAHAGCGDDAPATEDPGADDDSTDEDQDEPGAGAMRDATVAVPGQRDAGVTLRADAGGDAATARPVDASVQSIMDASSDAATDARTPPQPLDATTPPADAQTPAQVFKFDSTAVWAASGFKVEAGRCYQVQTKIDDKWLDLNVPADLSGWIDKNDPRLILFTPLRRVVQDDIAFYEFATCVEKKTDQCFPVGTDSTVCPKSSGELFFFINDASGFESNNVGTATVTIQAK